MGSFFRNQTFPENWHRLPFPGTLDFITDSGDTIFNAHPIDPGANDANGNYVIDPVAGVSL